MLPLEDVWPLAPEFDTLGVMTRNVGVLERVAAALLNTTCDHAPGSLRLGIDRHRLTACDPLVIAAINHMLRRVADAGIEIVSIVLPDREAVARAHGVIVLGNAREIYAQTWQRSPHLFPDPARRALTAAAKLTTADVRTARGQIASARKDLLAACQSVDAIVTPTLPVLPPRCDAHRVMLAGRDVPIVLAMIAETCLANVAGVPALSMPCPNPQGAFVSLQLLAPHGHDSRLITIAHQLARVFAER
jgi:aspartyl-tRNA(Asn)/glutamyl-tRNA(Gln) amidotransferase subunit A